MGKKKATKSRKLRPIIENAVSSGKVYCQSRSDKSPGDLSYNWGLGYETYQIAFGADVDWFQNKNFEEIHVIARVYEDGLVQHDFVFSKLHTLDATTSRWFNDLLGEIIVMHKLGAYQSKSRIVGYPYSYYSKFE